MSINSETIEKILSLAEVQEIGIQGRTYTDKHIHPVLEPMAEAVLVHNLTGLVDYVTSNVDALEPGNLLVHVVNPIEVRLMSALRGDFRQRETLIMARADIPEHSFDEWLGSEEFIIWLQSGFQKDSLPFNMEMLDQDATAPEGGFGLAALLALTSSMKTDEGVHAADDGVSQTVTARSGIHLVNNAKVPNPVKLRPFRTFTEVDQPESDFVFRVNRSLNCRIIEADGGAWRNKAMKAVQKYLVENLPEGLKVIA